MVQKILEHAFDMIAVISWAKSHYSKKNFDIWYAKLSKDNRDIYTNFIKRKKQMYTDLNKELTEFYKKEFGIKESKNEM